MKCTPETEDKARVIVGVVLGLVFIGGLMVLFSLAAGVWWHGPAIAISVLVYLIFVSITVGWLGGNIGFCKEREDG